MITKRARALLKGQGPLLKDQGPIKGHLGGKLGPNPKGIDILVPNPKSLNILVCVPKCLDVLVFDPINSPGQRPSCVLDPEQRFISATSYQYPVICFRYCLQYLLGGAQTKYSLTWPGLAGLARPGLDKLGRVSPGMAKPCLACPALPCHAMPCGKGNCTHAPKSPMHLHMPIPRTSLHATGPLRQTSIL